MKLHLCSIKRQNKTDLSKQVGHLDSLIFHLTNSSFIPPWNSLYLRIVTRSWLGKRQESKQENNSSSILNQPPVSSTGFLLLPGTRCSPLHLTHSSITLGCCWRGPSVNKHDCWDMRDQRTSDCHARIMNFWTMHTPRASKAPLNTPKTHELHVCSVLTIVLTKGFLTQD